jgi:hypothetical protein
MAHFGKFALEDIHLVQEEDDQRVEEPLWVETLSKRTSNSWIQPPGSVVRNKLSAEVVQSDKAGEHTVFDSSKGPDHTRSTRYKRWY